VHRIPQYCPHAQPAWYSSQAPSVMRSCMPQHGAAKQPIVSVYKVCKTIKTSPFACWSLGDGVHARTAMQSATTLLLVHIVLKASQHCDTANTAAVNKKHASAAHTTQPTRKPQQNPAGDSATQRATLRTAVLTQQCHTHCHQTAARQRVTTATAT
jgi:hypothetical protein